MKTVIAFLFIMVSDMFNAGLLNGLNVLTAIKRWFLTQRKDVELIGFITGLIVIPLILAHIARDIYIVWYKGLIVVGVVMLFSAFTGILFVRLMYAIIDSKYTQQIIHYVIESWQISKEITKRGQQ